MEHIGDFLIPHIKTLREKIVDSEFLTVDEKNKAVDELDDLQETIAYRQLPVIEL